ncbi:hypothetical protein IQA72_17535, partial [Leptospira borgpetersenii serovar Ballum]|nr:hypothetical protein [Leptospira borgpetersenii serovar Ballum]
TLADEHNVADMLSLVGQTIETPVGGANQDKLTIITPSHQGDNALVFTRSDLQQTWTQVSYQIAKRRDNPECVQQEFDLIADPNHHGLIAQANYDLNQKVEEPYLESRPNKPKV